MATIESTTQTSSTASPERRTGKRFWNSAMKLVRRVHLYSGIVMFPFVLLYGVTGWLFNHPRHFSGDQITSFASADVADDRLSQLSSPDVMANEVVSAINTKFDGEVVLTDFRPAQFSGFLGINVKTKDGSHSLTIDPSSGDGEVRTRLPDDKKGVVETNPLLSVRRVEFDHNALEEAKQVVPKVLEDLGLEEGEVSAGRRGTSLTFSADIDGVPSVVSCNLGNGEVSAVREDSLPATKTKSFLQRLHLSRTYAPHLNIRWFWALLVDGMVLSMVFWGLSGLIMWWQIKRTRLLGGGFLVASLICTTWLTIGMHDQTSVSSGLRNSRPRQQRTRAEPTKTDRKIPEKPVSK